MFFLQEFNRLRLCPNCGDKSRISLPTSDFPVIEMAGFAPEPSSDFAIELAAFPNRRYRPTVSRLIPNSLAIRRRDHPCSARP